MPELPEVETLRRQLEEEVVGQRVVAVEVFDPKLSGTEALFRGREIRGVRRWGKLLEFLTDGKGVFLGLRMTGRLLWGRPKGDHVRLTLHLPGGTLHLVDLRRFATFWPASGAVPPLGVDPLEEDLSGRLPGLAKGLRVTVKAFLMDQRRVRGIGNIYASEILYRAGVHPLREAGSITPGQWERIARATRDVLREAIRHRGTTIRDWRDLYGRPGGYQNRLMVYGRKGKPCPRCGTPIARLQISGRGTYLCPRCQN